METNEKTKDEQTQSKQTATVPTAPEYDVGALYQSIRTPTEQARTQELNQEQPESSFFSPLAMNGSEMWTGQAKTFDEAVTQVPVANLDSLPTYSVDAFEGAIAGVPKAVEELAETANSITNWGLEKLGVEYRFPEDIDLVPDVLKPKTFIGGLAQTSVSFAVRSWILGSIIGSSDKASELLKKGSDSLSLYVSQKLNLPFDVAKGFVKNIGQGFVTDLTRNPNDAMRFSDWLTQLDNPICNNAITQYLKSDPTDSTAEMRFKNALEGIVPNALIGLMSVHAKKMWYKAHDKIWPKSLDADEVRWNKEIRAEIEQSLANNTNVEVGNPKVPKPNPGPKTPEMLTEETYLPKSGHINTVLMPNADKKDTLLNPNYMTKQAQYWTKKMDDATRLEVEALGNQTENGDLWKISSRKMKNDAVAFVQRLNPLDAPETAKQLESEAVNATNEAMEKQIRLACLYQMRAVPAVNRSYAKFITAAQNNAMTPQIVQDLADDLALTTKLGAQLYRVRGRFGALLQSLQQSSNFTPDPNNTVTTTLLDMSDDQIKDMFRKLKPDVLAQLAGGMNAVGEATNSTQAMAWFIGQAQDLVNNNARTGEEVFRHWFEKILYFSRLSGPNTHVRNNIENLTRAGLIDPSDRYFASLVHTGSFDFANGELAAGIKGAKIGWEKAKQALYYVTKYGENVLESNNKPVIKTDDGILSRILEKPGIGLNAADEILAQTVYSEKAHQALFRKTNSAEWKAVFGDAPEAVKKKFEDTFINSYYRDAAIAPGVVAHGLTSSRLVDTRWGINATQALNETRDVLMKGIHAENKLYQWCQATRRIPYLGPLIMPFVRVSYNVGADALVRHNPIGLVRLLLQKDLDPEAKAKVWGQFATTAIMFVAGAELVSAGKITGAGPRSQAARAAWFEAGYRPYSYMTDDGTVIPIGNMTAAAPFTLIADMYERFWDVDYKDPEGQNIFVSAINSFTGYMLDKTVLQGAIEFANGLHDRNLSYFFNSNFSSFFTPQIFNTARSMIDSNIREHKDSIGGFIPSATIANRTPFLSYTNPIKYSWLTGEPIEDAFTGGLGEYGGSLRAVQAALLPVSKRNMNKNQKFLEIMAKTKTVQGPDRVFSTGVVLNDEDYSEYCKLIGTYKAQISDGVPSEYVGKTLEQALTHDFETEEWKKAGVDPSPKTLSKAREDLIRRTCNMWYRMAENQMYERHPDMEKFAEEHTRWYKEQRAGLTDAPEPVYRKLIEGI